MIGQLVYSFILTVYYKTLTLLRVIPTDAAITSQLVALSRCVMRAHFPVYKLHEAEQKRFMLRPYSV